MKCSFVISCPQVMKYSPSASSTVSCWPGLGHGKRLQPFATAGNGSLARRGEHCPAGRAYIKSKFFHIASCVFIGRQFSAQKAFDSGAKGLGEPGQQRDIRAAQPALPL